MKKYIFAFAMLLLNICLIISNNIFAQGFNSITTPDGVNITAVGNSGKLYRSSSGGVTWTSFTHGALNMNCVTSFNNDVWIASNNGTVYKTLKTVSALSTFNVGSSTNLNSVDFIDANIGFVCGDGGAVYRSVNGGISWTLSNSGIGLEKLNSVTFSDLNNGTVVGNTGAIFKTNDGGSTWSLQTSGTTRNLLKVKYFGSDIIAVGEYGTLLINTGSGFTSVVSRTKTDIRGVTGTDINDVHICGGGGFIRNNKSGNTKFTNFEANPMMANLVDIFYYDANKAWAVSSLNSVIIYTGNGGTSWSMPSGSTMTRTWVSKLTAGSGIGNNLCEHPNDRNTMFVVYGSTVYVSRNRGETWASTATITGGGAAHSFYVSPLDTNIWMCAITSSPDRVTRSTNRGLNWSTVLSSNFSNYGQPLEMDQNNPSTYYFVPDGGGFYRSTDNGASFAEISGNYPFRSPCDIIVTWDSSNVILVGDGVTGSGLAKIFKSINGGVNWTEMYTVTSSETPSLCNTVFDNSVTYSTEWGGSGFYKSSNYGNNWALTGTTGGSGWGSDVCHEDPTMILKGTYGSPHYLTTNSGTSFQSTSCGGGAGAGIIVPDRGYLLAMQTGGLLKMSITYTDSPSLSNYTQVDLKLAPEGFYNGSTLNMSDTITAYLRNTISPFAKVDSSRVVLNSTTFIAPALFQNTQTGSYYIHIKHRNAIETWSKTGGVSLTAGVYMSYDFTSAITQAYGSNMVLVGSKYCFFSGDVNQNGTIDGSDLVYIDNDAFNFESGYLPTDLNGDGLIDGSDLALCDNNASNFITKNTPESGPKTTHGKQLK